MEKRQYVKMFEEFSRDYDDMILEGKIIDFLKKFGKKFGDMVKGWADLTPEKRYDKFIDNPKAITFIANNLKMTQDEIKKGLIIGKESNYGENKINDEKAKEIFKFAYGVVKKFDDEVAGRSGSYFN